MLLSELLNSLHRVRDNVSSCDIPVLINGLPVDFVGAGLWSDSDCLVLKLWIKPSQVEGHQPETQVS